MRLDKFLSETGTLSRSESKKAAKSGRICINGLPVRDTSLHISPESDKVTLDGAEIKYSRYTYIMLNKPRGYVTTLSDEKGRPCITDLIKDVGKRVYPVGRLDMYSEGLLILTDDGDFANRLMHPSHEMTKTYHAWVNGKCSVAALDRLRSPFDIDGYKTKPAEVEILYSCDDYTQLSISIHEGRNRQIRKMCEQTGLKLTKLKRVAEGKLELGALKPGKWRVLTEHELQVLSEENR